MTIMQRLQRLSALVLILILAACSLQPGPTPLPTVEPAPTAAGARSGQRPRMGTYFFYWYDCPRHECDPTQLSVLPPGWTSPLPRDPDPRDGTAYSSLNYDWYEGELRDMLSVGIDIVFPVSWGDHPHSWFRQDRLATLVQANGVLEKPLQIGMFIDTTAQQAMYNDRENGAYRFGPGQSQLPLSDPLSGYYFYDMHIKDYFRQIPREMWATEQGRPIIIAYTAQCCSQLRLAGEMWGAVKDAFKKDFGVAPWLILEDTWFTVEAQAPGAELRGINEVADGRYSWGSALNGPASHTLHAYTVSSVGPGFDNRRIQDVVDPRYQPRDQAPEGGAAGDGAFLHGSLAAVPANTNLLLIETWNEWPESTAVARADYTGRDGRPLPDDFYMQIIRQWRSGG